MGLGESSRSMFVEDKLDNIFDLLKNSINNVGELIEANKKTKTLVAKTKYGFQRVRIRISLIPENEGVKINFNGFGDDIWGGGARKGIDRIISEFESLL